MQHHINKWKITTSSFSCPRLNLWLSFHAWFYISINHSLLYFFTS